MEHFLLVLMLISLAAAILGVIKPSLVIRWGDPEKKSRGKAVGIYLAATVFFFVAFGISLPKDNKTQPITQQEQEKPRQATTQKMFVKEVNLFMDTYDDAKNAIKKTQKRQTRATVLPRILGDTKEARHWTGVLLEMGTETNGDAFITVRPDGAEGWTIQTWNNSLSDIDFHTLIKSGTEVHQALADMDKGDRVIFSGYFFPSNTDGIKEASMTEVGSMTDPEFILKFTSIKKL